MSLATLTNIPGSGGFPAHGLTFIDRDSFSHAIAIFRHSSSASTARNRMPLILTVDPTAPNSKLSWFIVTLSSSADVQYGTVIFKGVEYSDVGRAITLASGTRRQIMGGKAVFVPQTPTQTETAQHVLHTEVGDQTEW